MPSSFHYATKTHAYPTDTAAAQPHQTSKDTA